MSDLVDRRKYDGPGCKMASGSERARVLRTAVERAVEVRRVCETPSSRQARRVSRCAEVSTGSSGMSELRAEFREDGVSKLRSLADVEPESRMTEASLCREEALRSRVARRHGKNERVALRAMLWGR